MTTPKRVKPEKSRDYRRGKPTREEVGRRTSSAMTQALRGFYESVIQPIKDTQGEHAEKLDELLSQQEIRDEEYACLVRGLRDEVENVRAGARNGLVITLIIVILGCAVAAIL